MSREEKEIKETVGTKEEDVAGEQKMKQLKEEYMNVQPPKNGLEQLEKTIGQAKKDRRRVEKVHFFRNAAVGMAAMFAGVFVMVNVNADIAYAMEKIPFIGGVIKVITLNNYSQDREGYHAKVDTPKLEAQEETKGVKDVNEAVKEDTNALILQCKEEFASEQGVKSVDASYDVVTDSEEWFTLRISITEAQGSSQQLEKYYNINRKTGEMVRTLSELFPEGSDYITKISDNIKEQMRQQMAEGEEKIYNIDSEPGVDQDDFDKIGADQNFCINTDGNLVIAFDEYEVAPGYMGAVSFVIPKDVVSDMEK